MVKSYGINLTKGARHMERCNGGIFCFAASCLFLILGAGAATATSQAGSSKGTQPANLDQELNPANLEQELNEVVKRYPLAARAILSILDPRSPAPCNLDTVCFRRFQDFCFALGDKTATDECLESGLAACCDEPVVAPPETPVPPPCATEDPLPGYAVTSSSDLFRAAARSLVPACNLPAEFGRCSCTLDGMSTSCDIVNRCLDLGFCVKVTAE